MPKFERLYEADRVTNRMMRFALKVEGGEALRESDAPYIYLSKVLLARMGHPQVVRVTVEPVLPK